MRSTFSISFALLLVLGVAIAWQFQSQLPRLGSLPGDFVFDTNQFRLYLPLGSALSLCVLVNFFAWSFRKLA